MPVPAGGGPPGRVALALPVQRRHHHGPAVMAVVVVVRTNDDYTFCPQSSAGGGGGEGTRGNPDANSNPNRGPSVAAQADIDFGPYMTDLQRRIKRAWFPPKGNESKRVVVIFKVHKGGELSNLRLDHSSEWLLLTRLL